MTVYIVTIGYDYEGISNYSVYSNKEAADSEAALLRAEDMYRYANINVEEHEVK